jgi:hypothetical protein
MERQPAAQLLLRYLIPLGRASVPAHYEIPARGLKIHEAEEMKSLRWQKIPILSILLIFLPVVWLGPLSAQTEGDQLSVAGMVKDAQGKGISGVRVEVLVNGRTMAAESPEPVVTDQKGTFLVKIPMAAMASAKEMMK